MPNEKAARRLGIGHEDLPLPYDPHTRSWRNPANSAWEKVESAALGHFAKLGWSGYAGEGELILNLIKAMSFKRIPFRHRSTFIEALYAQNVAFEEDRYDLDDLLDNVRSATERQVRRNFDRMTSRECRRISYAGVSHFSSSSVWDYFPRLRLNHLVGLMTSLGNDRVLSIATSFARDPYEYRRGWPDLTLWKGTEVAFKEVKAPGDRLRASQTKTIRDVLRPLGFDVSVVDVVLSQEGDGLEHSATSAIH